ncbi:MAG TPA: TRAP transporter substrate-binding protein [Stellaceae bacterium]|jgi:TRAP-type C4-dicarboxylate transport system substrate-binding protein|nr:TRAP transporter substrate-binding protein [Stellaceae bacterium]
MKKTLLAALGLALLAAPAFADPVQIKFAYPSAPNNALFRAMQGWTDDVNKAANGAIEVKLFPGGVIADNSNMYDRVTGGVADIGFAVFGPVSSVFPKTNVGTLPFEAKDHREDALALWALYDKGVIRDELTKYHPLAFIVFPGLVIHSKKPIHTLADVKGMKISVEGRVLSEMIPRLGAAPISLQPGELYQSLQRGLVEAVPQGWPSVPTFHLNEVTSFHLEAPLGFNTGYVAMNNDSYAKLPPAGKAAIDKLSGKVFVERLIAADDTMQAVGRDATKALPGQTIAQLDPAEEARWKEAVAPVTEEWVKATPDGAHVLAAFRAELTAIRSGK